jgi:hypothetical protein
MPIDYSIVLKIKRKNACKGVIIAYLVTDQNGDKGVLCGHSLCSKEDRFNMDVAYDIAVSRGAKRFTHEVYEIPPSIKNEWEEMMFRMARYFKGDDILFPRWYTKP